MADLASVLAPVLALAFGLAIFDVLALAFGEDSRDSYPDDRRRAFPGGTR